MRKISTVIFDTFNGSPCMRFVDDKGNKSPPLTSKTGGLTLVNNLERMSNEAGGTFFPHEKAEEIRQKIRNSDVPL